MLIQAKINTGEYWQYDNSTQLGYRSVFKICIDDGNEVTYSIAVGDGSVHSGVQVYEENPSGKSHCACANSLACATIETYGCRYIVKTELIQLG